MQTVARAHNERPIATLPDQAMQRGVIEHAARRCTGERLATLAWAAICAIADQDLADMAGGDEQPGPNMRRIAGVLALIPPESRSPAGEAAQ